MLVGQNTRLMVAGEITRGSLLQKLQEIWDEVGESNEEICIMLVQMEQECLDVYKRHVEQAEKSREQLLQSLSDAKDELYSLVLALGNKTLVAVLEKTTGTIKEQIAAMTPVLEQLRKQKKERVKEFYDVQTQIQRVSAEIAGTINEQTGAPILDESDLSQKNLDEYQFKLQELQKEKSDRLQKVLGSFSTVHELCAVIGMDFLSTLTEVYPSLNGWKDILSKSIDNESLLKLTKTVFALKEVKKQQRLSELQKLATQIDLWHLLDTANEERKSLDHVTRIMSVSTDEVMVHGAPNLIQQATAEVERLNEMKANKIREIAIEFKRQTEDEEKNAHGNREISPDPATLISSTATEGVSHKSLLQEYAQRLCLPFPRYHTVNDGLLTAPKFRAIVCVGESYSSQNTFSNEKDAEQDVARVALKCIKDKIKMEKFPLIYEDPAVCKPILNEFSAKMKLEMPTYNYTFALGDEIKRYRSSLVFNSVTYTGDYAMSKKGAEQFGARAAILSLLGNPAYAMELSEIINSKAQISSSLSKGKDSCNDESTDSTAWTGQVKQIFLPKRKQLSDQVGISNPSLPPVSEQTSGVTENGGRYTKKEKREANNKSKTFTLVRWVAPPIDKAKLNTDGSVNRNCGLAAAGGVLRDSNGNWRGGFVANLGKVDVLKAELSGLREGLLLAKLRGFRSMIVEVDSLDLTKLLLSDTKSHPLADSLEECRVLMRELDVDRVDHTLREGNVCADFLSSLGHSYPFGMHVLADPPLGLGQHLLAYMQGVGFLRK